MKRAKQFHLKPRNPLVAVAILKKAGAHRRVDKHASRARQRQQLKEEISAD